MLDAGYDLLCCHKKWFLFTIRRFTLFSIQFLQCSSVVKLPTGPEH
jgi:hypothetical protein